MKKSLIALLMLCLGFSLVTAHAAATTTTTTTTTTAGTDKTRPDKEDGPDA